MAPPLGSRCAVAMAAFAAVAVLLAAPTEASRLRLPEEAAWSTSEIMFKRKRASSSDTDSADSEADSNIQLNVKCTAGQEGPVYSYVAWAVWASRNADRSLVLAKSGELYCCTDPLPLDYVCWENAVALPEEKQHDVLVGRVDAADCATHYTTRTYRSLITADGVYNVAVVRCNGSGPAGLPTGNVTFRNPHGLLPANLYPLLPFYGSMSLLYLFLGLLWLAVCACYWRSLLRLQYYISVVLFLGMLAMAIFYADYHSYNSSGTRDTSLMIFASVLYCLKKTLARMLVLIVALGFGLVKPTLGETMRRVVVLGLVYFVVSAIFDASKASFEQNPAHVEAKRLEIFAMVPIAILHAVIIWWVFISLHRTMVQLQARRQEAKLALYKRFTYTLFTMILIAVPFTIYDIVHIRKPENWTYYWVHVGFWHVLFFVVLLVLCVLWRPMTNNTRYSYQPLQDDVMEFDMATPTEAFGELKQRTDGSQDDDTEDDLRWVEENIPGSSGRSKLPTDFLDDDEDEIFNKRREQRKME